MLADPELRRRNHDHAGDRELLRVDLGLDVVVRFDGHCLRQPFDQRLTKRDSVAQRIDIGTNDVEVILTGNYEDIEVDGNDNTVIGDTADTIDMEGDGNTAAAEAVEDTSIDGDDDTVIYGTGETVIEKEGNNPVSAR